MTSPIDLGPRALNRRGNVFRHYKWDGIDPRANLYRRLFSVSLVGVTADGNGGLVLMNVLHSDDARVLTLIVGRGGVPVVIDSSYRGPDRVGELYVSCDKQTVWWRAFEEFHGVVTLGDGSVVKRFAPVVDGVPDPLDVMK